MDRKLKLTDDERAILAANNRLVSLAKLKSEDWAKPQIRTRESGAVHLQKINKQIVKTYKGQFSGLAWHETDVLSDIARSQLPSAPIQAIPRVVKKMSETLDTNIGDATITLEDCGPDVSDWFRLLGPTDSYRPPPNSDVFTDPVWLLVFVAQVLESLEPFHANGYVHCDLKVDNICIKSNLVENAAGGYWHGKLSLQDLKIIDVGTSLKPPKARELPLDTSDKVGSRISIRVDGQEKYNLPSHFGIDLTQPVESQTVALSAKVYGALDKPWFDARDLFLRRLIHDDTEKVSTAHIQGLTGNALANMQQKLAEMDYISDHYFWAAHLAGCFDKDEALKALDWRIDFHSLGCLVAQLLSQRMSVKLYCDPKSPKLYEKAETLLRALPKILGEMDTWPIKRPAWPSDRQAKSPHQILIDDIFNVLGRDCYNAQFNRSIVVQIDSKGQNPDWAQQLDMAYLGSVSTQSTAQVIEALAKETKLASQVAEPISAPVPVPPRVPRTPLSPVKPPQIKPPTPKPPIPKPPSALPQRTRSAFKPIIIAASMASIVYGAWALWPQPTLVNPPRVDQPPPVPPVRPPPISAELQPHIDQWLKTSVASGKWQAGLQTLAEAMSKASIDEQMTALAAITSEYSTLSTLVYAGQWMNTKDAPQSADDAAFVAATKVLSAAPHGLLAAKLNLGIAQVFGKAGVNGAGRGNVAAGLAAARQLIALVQQTEQPWDKTTRHLALVAIKGIDLLVGIGRSNPALPDRITGSDAIAAYLAVAQMRHEPPIALSAGVRDVHYKLGHLLFCDMPSAQTKESIASFRQAAVTHKGTAQSVGERQAIAGANKALHFLTTGQGLACT